MTFGNGNGNGLAHSQTFGTGTGMINCSPLSALDLEIVLASLTPKKLSSSTTARYPSGDWSCFHFYHFPIVNSWHFFVVGSLWSSDPEALSKSRTPASSISNSLSEVSAHLTSSTKPRTLSLASRGVGRPSLGRGPAVVSLS